MTTESSSPQSSAPKPSGFQSSAPVFDAAFQAQFEALLHWRRDVRRFRPDTLPEGLLERLLALADLAPSVGLSQPWRFVRVTSPDLRREVIVNFESANAAALADYSDSRAALYARLKLAGLREAPEQLAVFADLAPEAGQGLGRRTMPETLQYSAVCAVHTLWLAARAAGIGLGWVSILEPQAVASTLSVPESWCLVAYLCLGYPEEEHLAPELERAGWQDRTPGETRLITR